MTLPWRTLGVVAALALLVGVPLAKDRWDAWRAQEMRPSLEVAVVDVRESGYEPRDANDSAQLQTVFGMRLNVTNIGKGAYELDPHDWAVGFLSSRASRPYGWDDVLHDDSRLPRGASTQYRFWVVAYGSANATITSLEFNGQTVATAEDFARAASVGDVLLV